MFIPGFLTLAVFGQLALRHPDMRSRGLFILLVAVVFLFCLWLFRFAVQSPRNGGLSVVFLGLTNAPGRSVYPRLSVVSDGRGLHGLFAVTNVSENHYLKFGISAVENQVGRVWKTHGSKIFQSELGGMWTPGHGSVYAIPWPAGLGTDESWRLRLWVMREPKPIFRLINQRLGRELFRPRGRYSVTSSVVTPWSLLIPEPGTYVEDVQAGGDEPPPRASVPDGR